MHLLESFLFQKLISRDLFFIYRLLSSFGPKNRKLYSPLGRLEFYLLLQTNAAQLWKQYSEMLWS